MNYLQTLLFMSVLLPVYAFGQTPLAAEDVTSETEMAVEVETGKSASFQNALGAIPERNTPVIDNTNFDIFTKYSAIHPTSLCGKFR